jgi:hypothetical protein
VKQLARPVIEPTIVGNEIRPSPDSPYGVEVFVEEGPRHYRALTPRVVGPLVRVDLKPGNLYALRVHNRSKFESAVEVLIDGLSRFALADDQRQSNGRDVVPPQRVRTIFGYFRDGKTVNAFEVGKYSESEAARKLPSGIDIGTITCTFAAAWKVGEPVPDQEPSKVRNKGELGTTSGPPRHDPTQHVNRNIGAIRAVVKVRY